MNNGCILSILIPNKDGAGRLHNYSLFNSHYSFDGFIEIDERPE